jgi:predicted transcriptional regulator
MEARAHWFRRAGKAVRKRNGVEKIHHLYGFKELMQKSIFQNNNAVVTSVLKKDEFYAKQSRCFVEDTFGGSLPKFLTAFIGGKKLSNEQAAELKELIDRHKEG